MFLVITLPINSNADVGEQHPHDQQISVNQSNLNSPHWPLISKTFHKIKLYKSHWNQ